MKINVESRLFLIALSGLILNSCSKSGNADYSTWSSYGGTKDANRYSSIDQINTANVSKLEVAWVFNTGDRDTSNRSEMQCNPIVIDGNLYVTSAKFKLYALDAASGKQKWVFDPASMSDESTGFGISRGVMFWQDETVQINALFMG